MVKLDSAIPHLDPIASSELYFDLTQAFQTMLPMFEQLLEMTLASRSLQVIVSATYYLITPGRTFKGSLSFLSSLHLSWPSPSFLLFSSGLWPSEDLEQPFDQPILARGWYCLSNSANITQSSISFRDTELDHIKEDELDLAQDLQSILRRHCTLPPLTTTANATATPHHHNPIAPSPRSDLPHILALPGRALVWENDLDYRLETTVAVTEPSSSGDGDEMGVGVQKFLSFALVDPDVRVLSTKHVSQLFNPLHLPSASASVRHRNMTCDRLFKKRRVEVPCELKGECLEEGER
jgi:hypothetical protein